jgi:hypothetical protein
MAAKFASKAQKMFREKQLKRFVLKKQFKNTFEKAM